MKMFKNRTKIEAGVLTILLLLIAVSSVFNSTVATVTIKDTEITTDSSLFKIDTANNWIRFKNATVTDNVSAGNISASGDIESSGYFIGDGSFLTGISSAGYDPTRIWNSNGNNWSATGANIQSAIWDLDNNSGIVWLPGNTTIITSSTIQMGKYVTLDMQGCEIKPNGDFHVISMESNAVVKNGFINASGIDGFYSAGIVFDGNRLIGNCWFPQGPFSHTVVQDMRIKGKIVTGAVAHPEDFNGTGIYMFCNESTASGQHIIGANVYRVCIEQFKYGIYLNSSKGTSDHPNYINSNYFNGVTMMNVRYGIRLDENVGSGSSYVDANIFTNIVNQLERNSENVLWAEGDFNEFSIVAWDHGKMVYSGNDIYNLTQYCNYSYMKASGGVGRNVNDGHYNTVWMVADSISFGDAITMDYSLLNGVDHVNFDASDPSVIDFFYSQVGSGVPHQTDVTFYGDTRKSYFTIQNSVYGTYLLWNTSRALVLGGGTGGIYLNSNANGDVTCNHIASTGDHPLFKWGGRNTADTATGYLQLHWNDDGTISTTGGNITLDPNKGKVTIDDVLHLNPKASPPTAYTEGDMYYDSSFHKLRIRNETAWVNVTVS